MSTPRDSGDGVADLDQTFPTADGEPAGPCVQCGSTGYWTTQHGNPACSAWPSCRPTWTVGQLRAALDGVDEHTEDEHTEDEHTEDEQLVFHAGLDPTVWYGDSRSDEPPRRTADGWFTISADFSPADYTKGSAVSSDQNGDVRDPGEVAEILAMRGRRLAMDQHRRAVADGRAAVEFLELPRAERDAAIAAATEFVETAHAAGMLDLGVDPRAPQPPATCDHPGAYVHAHAGRLPGGDPGSSEGGEDDAGPAVPWRRSISDPDNPRRPGEQLVASLGACGACGALVAGLAVFHPDDIAGGWVPQYRTRWVGLYGPTARDTDVPADAAQSALPPGVQR